MLNEQFPLTGEGHIIGLLIQVCLGNSILGRAGQHSWLLSAFCKLLRLPTLINAAVQNAS